MVNEKLISVEVAYALPDKQQIITVQVPIGATARDAARLSGIAQQFEGLDLETSDMGIFGKAVKPAEHIIQAGERVEIYRPLIIDPKEVRKKRAEKVAKARQSR